MWIVEITGTQDIMHGEMVETITTALGRRGIPFDKVKVSWNGPESDRPTAKNRTLKQRERGVRR